MALVDLNTIALNTRLSFRSKETKDTSTKVGTLKGIIDYNLVSSFEDIIPRYQAIRKQYPDMVELSELQFFSFEINQDGKKAKYIIAKEWIDTSSVEIIQYTNSFIIKLFDIPESQVVDALNLLKSNGFKCAKE